jgi:hypothetical protein
MSTDNRTSTKQVALPFRVSPTAASRRTSVRHIILGIVVVAAIAGGVALFMTEDLQAAAVTAGAFVLGSGLLCWRALSAPVRGDDRQGSVTVSAARIQCTASVRGTFGWDELTTFRWVLQQEEEDAIQFERSDGNSSLRIPAQGFIVEAAQLSDPEQSNEYGFYDRPAIQFELDDLYLTPPTRQDADALIRMLNGLQAAAVAGTLRDGDLVEIPAILNAVSPTEPAQRPIRPEPVAVVRR